MSPLVAGFWMKMVMRYLRAKDFAVTETFKTFWELVRAPSVPGTARHLTF